MSDVNDLLREALRDERDKRYSAVAELAPYWRRARIAELKLEAIREYAMGTAVSEFRGFVLGIIDAPDA